MIGCCWTIHNNGVYHREGHSKKFSIVIILCTKCLKEQGGKCETSLVGTKFTSCFICVYRFDVCVLYVDRFYYIL